MMKNIVPTLCIYVLCVFLLSWALPEMYSMFFKKEVAKTALFFSPIDKKMIYTEQLLIDDMQAKEKSENHHADVAYKDEDGKYYSREEFEAKIPFIYFRNMELRGLLPLEIDGKIYDRTIIEKHRRVLELSSRQLDHKKHEESIYPLLESNPNQVALVLPTDRFRMTKHTMEFINSDKNIRQSDLSDLFTNALDEKGFIFPAQKVWGNFSIFKPYDAGIFVLDSEGQSFHVLRKNNMPIITKIPFDKGFIPAKIIVSEAKDRKLFGLLLDTKNQIHLFHTENYALTRIPSPGYNPETMDIKILLDPIYLTVIYSDNKNIKATAFYYDDEDKKSTLSPLHTFSMPMSRTQKTYYGEINQIIFPFTIELKADDSAKAVFNISMSKYFLTYSLIFNLFLTLLYSVFCRVKGYSFPRIQSAFIVCFGLYIFIPLFCMEQYRKR